MGKNSDYDCRLKDRGIINIDKRVLKSFERDRNKMNRLFGAQSGKTAFDPWRMMTIRSAPPHAAPDPPG